MKYKKSKYYVAFLCGIVAVCGYAQESVVSSGANLSGTGGSVSYSIGQVCYSTDKSAGGSVAQGVQQPYEIQVLLGLDEYEVNLQARAYPNPTINELHLTLGNLNPKGVSYRLFDIRGRLLASGELESEVTIIAMTQYPRSQYLLSVAQDNKILKTFKIQKN